MLVATASEACGVCLRGTVYLLSDEAVARILPLKGNSTS